LKKKITLKNESQLRIKKTVVRDRSHDNLPVKPGEVEGYYFSQYGCIESQIIMSRRAILNLKNNPDFTTGGLYPQFINYLNQGKPNFAGHFIILTGCCAGYKDYTTSTSMVDIVRRQTKVNQGLCSVSV